MVRFTLALDGTSINEADVVSVLYKMSTSADMANLIVDVKIDVGDIPDLFIYDDPIVIDSGEYHYITSAYITEKAGLSFASDVFVLKNCEFDYLIPAMLCN